MPRTVIIVGLLFLIPACGAKTGMQKTSKRLTDGGEAYCEAYLAGNSGEKSSIAERHGLNAAHWDEYCESMKKANYSFAVILAKRYKLGPAAIRKAGVPAIWKEVESGYFYVAYTISNEIEIGKAERTALADMIFTKLMVERKCADAINVASIFDLSDASKVEALACIESANGPSAALVYACIKPVPDHVVAGYKDAFLSDLPKWYGQTYRKSDFEDAVLRCAWDQAALEKLYDFLLGSGDLMLSLHMLDDLGRHWPKKRQHKEAEQLFAKAVSVRDTGSAGLILKAFPGAIDANGKDKLLDLYLEERLCPEALAFAHKEKLSDVKLDKIFLAPRCISSEFDQFAWVLPATNPDVWLRYFDLALKHKRFALARSLADEAKLSRSGPKRDLYKVLIDAALAERAHFLLLQLPQPPDEKLEAYRNRIFEHALDHGDEWTAATFAKEYHSNPE